MHCSKSNPTVLATSYLQPASLSLRAYIFPMSPMPMMPTMNFSMPRGTLELLPVAMTDVEIFLPRLIAKIKGRGSKAITF